MKVPAVIERLQTLSDPRAIAIWAKMKIGQENYLGVNITKLKALAKEIKKNHVLALELWQIKIHDAKLLATLIEEPKKVTLPQIDQQMTEIYSIDLLGQYCSNVLIKTPFAQAKIEQWRHHDQELLKRAAFKLLYHLAYDDKNLPDQYFQQFLAQIEQELQQEKNWVKEFMNYALIAIGSRNRQLNQQALTIAKRLGKVEVDYGETSCQTADAVEKLTAEKLVQSLL